MVTRSPTPTPSAVGETAFEDGAAGAYPLPEVTSGRLTGAGPLGEAVHHHRGGAAPRAVSPA